MNHLVAFDEVELSQGHDAIALEGGLEGEIVVLEGLEPGETVGLACQRIDPPLLFERLWAETGYRTVIADLVADRGLEFAVERASVRGGAAPAHGLGLGSGLREMDAGLPY